MQTVSMRQGQGQGAWLAHIMADLAPEGQALQHIVELPLMVVSQARSC